MSPDQTTTRQTPPLDNQILENRFRDLWEAVDDLREKKQSKIGVMVWMPLLIWLFSSSAGILWGSATLVTKFQNLTQAVQTLSSTQVDTKDLALRDKDIEANEAAIAELKASAARIEQTLSEIRDRLP